ncbi:hypothetical protein DFH01_16985 [Falsiroseomonas bella]|uniref:Tat pathway signal sequence domain protein n=1 Tax=Falsiroseomonas bella TaxID=2184016 RepID=A0A317FBM0_9PROT|nr:hypothetical protein [Falsiroseomonas bella]PWS35329.1 hypothetical protein DFH01_16985 [Falsiroseomonas bella]
MLLRRIVLAALAALLSAGPALAQADPSFNLVNRSGQPIRELYVSPVSNPNWGHDLLGSDVLPDGRAFPVRIPPSAGCRQDVRVVYADGRPEERRNQDTCRITQMVFGSAAQAPPSTQEPAQGNPSFNLVNHGQQAMREVYVSSARDQNWGQQRLPRTMNPGEHLAVRLPLGECVNDVRVVWQDGRAEERRGLDTCGIVNLVFR